MSINAYRWAAGATVFAILAALAALSFSRDYFGFGTETDYLGAFLQEAARFQRGEALQLLYHPPFYSITIGLVQGVTDDWFLTGRIVSFVAAAIVLATSLSFFGVALSRAAAMGALVALASSPLFLIYGALATSDLFFLALYTASLALAFIAARRRSRAIWAAAGVAVGMAVLSRTNGISLLLILLLPLLDSGERVGSRVRVSVIILLGFMAPVLAWTAYAAATGSPLAPVNTHVNLAWTFFPPDGVQAWADGIDLARRNFPNAWSVFTHDPTSMLRHYAIGLYKLPARLAEAGGLLAYPLNLLFFPAILYLLYAAQERWVLYAVVLALGQVILMGFNIYLSRYYLFLLPLIGAAMGHAVEQLFFRADASSGTGFGRLSARLVIAGLVAVAVFNSVRFAHDALNKSGAELRESIPEVTKVIPPGSIIVARKPVIAFYTSGEAAGMPAGSSLDDLRRHVEAASVRAGDRDVFVYFGAAEQAHRPEYAELTSTPGTVEWLTLEISSSRQGEWSLYRFRDGLSESK